MRFGLVWYIVIAAMLVVSVLLFLGHRSDGGFGQRKDPYIKNGYVVMPELGVKISQSHIIDNMQFVRDPNDPDVVYVQTDEYKEKALACMGEFADDPQDSLLGESVGGVRKVTDDAHYTSGMWNKFGDARLIPEGFPGMGNCIGTDDDEANYEELKAMAAKIETQVKYAFEDAKQL